MSFDSQDMSNVTSLLGAFGGVATQYSAANMKIESGKMAAKGFRTDAASIRAITDYNKAVDQINLGRRLNEIKLGIRRNHATQLTQASANGLSATSQSSLAIMNASLNEASDRLVMERHDQEIRNVQNQYMADVQIVTNESNARISEWQAQTAAFNRKMEAIKGGIGAASAIGGLF